jgi:bifunctional non-homologous end joining protein LigD
MNSGADGYSASVATPEAMPETINPMTARPGKIPADQSGWAAEIKWDGIRAIAFFENGSVRLQGRRLTDISSQFPEITRPTEFPDGVVLDGEIVVFDPSGRPDFQMVQNRLRRGGRPATFVAFDVLYARGRDLRGRSYLERRAELDRLHFDGVHWRAPGYLDSDFEVALATVADQGLEGLMLKRKSSRYVDGRRSPDWLKIKVRRRQEFVIGGWLPGQGQRLAPLGSLLLGYWDDASSKDRSTGAESRDLIYAGRVGSGIGVEEAGRLIEALREFETQDSFFRQMPSIAGARFTQPALVAEVEFSQWTADGLLRHPVFLALRTDKDADEVVREAEVKVGW